MHSRGFMAGTAFAVAVALFAPASAEAAVAGPRATFETRAFLLDLARQTETIDFINAYVDKAADAVSTVEKPKQIISKINSK